MQTARSLLAKYRHFHGETARAQLLAEACEALLPTLQTPERRTTYLKVLFCYEDVLRVLCDRMDESEFAGDLLQTQFRLAHALCAANKTRDALIAYDRMTETADTREKYIYPPQRLTRADAVQIRADLAEIARHPFALLSSDKEILSALTTAFAPQSEQDLPPDE